MRNSGVSKLLNHWDQMVLGNFELTKFTETASVKKYGTRRLLLLSVSAGSGHVRAAEAILAHARADFPQLSVRHLDMMQLVPTLFKKIYSDLYMKLASGLPEAWGWLYRKTDHEPTGSLAARLRRTIQQLCSRRLFDEIAEFKPDTIVCTHFLPAEILATAVVEGRLHCDVWVQVTDFDLHHFWLHQGVSGYFVANEELAFRLQQLGVPAYQIVISGIPVMPGFVNPPGRSSAAARLNINPLKTTVLMMGGGGGVGLQVSLVENLLTQHPDLQLIVMAGKNQTLLRSLQSVSDFYPERLRVIGFTNDVHSLMACADLAITKPGGLSTSECLVMGLPMLLVHPIPGQEERNAAFLMHEGVAMRADDPATLQFRLQRLLSDRDLLSRMRAHAYALAKPKAAHEVLQRVIC